VTDDWVNTGGVRTLRLTPGLYHFQTPAATSDVTFEVTEDGKVGYDADFAGFLSGAGGTTLKLRGHSVGVDATPLSYQKLDLEVAGVEHSFDSNAPQPLRLLPGPHRLEAPEKSFDVAFEVTADGKVGYDGGFGRFLDGRDGETLVLRGYKIGVDATPLSYEKLALEVVGVDAEFDSTAPELLQLLPGPHQLKAPDKSFDVAFDVTTEGKVDYDAGSDGLLDGRDDDTLVVRGYEVGVALRASYSSIAVEWTVGPVDAEGVLRRRLLPGSYLVSGGGVRAGLVKFEVAVGGAVRYADELEGALEGRGTSVLVVRGYPIDIDARQLSSPSFSIDGLGSEMRTQDVHHLRLLPGSHRFRAPVGIDFTFSVTSPGMVHYDPRLEGFLDGDGTSTLIVHYAPGGSATTASGNTIAGGSGVGLSLWPLWAALVAFWVGRRVRLRPACGGVTRH
jgi:hypothetical protein